MNSNKIYFYSNLSIATDAFFWIILFFSFSKWATASSEISFQSTSVTIVIYEAASMKIEINWESEISSKYEFSVFAIDRRVQ